MARPLQQIFVAQVQGQKGRYAVQHFNEQGKQLRFSYRLTQEALSSYLRGATAYDCERVGVINGIPDSFTDRVDPVLVTQKIPTRTLLTILSRANLKQGYSRDNEIAVIF